MNQLVNARSYLVRACLLHASDVGGSQVEAGNVLRESLNDRSRVDIGPFICLVETPTVNIIVCVVACVPRSQSTVETSIFNLDNLMIAVLVGLDTEKACRELQTGRKSRQFLNKVTLRLRTKETYAESTMRAASGKEMLIRVRSSKAKAPPYLPK